MPKHDAQAIVASFDSQYWHCGASDEIAAPQFGQLRVWTGIDNLECAGLDGAFQIYHSSRWLSTEIRWTN